VRGGIAEGDSVPSVFEAGDVFKPVLGTGS
jgi:hypothetical protein